ncbi:MAG: hypothetical protein COA76_16425 [Moritella sp.]|nr:MAG: hypothetical protein COA81_01260 [Alphaproteobacteria bacterium]PHR86127.1 MAG: hypothetical protein COA76_16425 [Moritella sp.]
MKIIIALCFSIVLFSSSLFAAHAAPTLSGDDIQHFMNAMKPLKKLGAKYDFNDNGNSSTAQMAQTGFAPMSRSLAEVKNHEAYEEFKTIINKAGFSSPEQWAVVGDRVMRAYMSLKALEELTPEKIQELQVSIEAVEKNEYLSAETKKQLLGSMKQMITLKSDMPEESKADQDALKPYLAKLNSLFEELR